MNVNVIVPTVECLPFNLFIMAIMLQKLRAGILGGCLKLEDCTFVGMDSG
jgi:hypothetical protein